MNLFELKTVVINGDRRRDGSYKTFEQSMGIFSTRNHVHSSRNDGLYPDSQL